MSNYERSPATATPEYWAEREAFVVAQLDRTDLAERTRRELEAALAVVRRARSRALTRTVAPSDHPSIIQ